ncbi:MAG: phosphorylase, partial [Paramuribaculum sp.]|nr:phosphorylase [Paramuribaculum sp.]
MAKTIESSELIINSDGSVFHLHLKPEQLADKIILVGDPSRVDLVPGHFDSIDFTVQSREFRPLGGTL